jgi:hypothetical protein
MIVGNPRIGGLGMIEGISIPAFKEYGRPFPFPAQRNTQPPRAFEDIFNRELFGKVKDKSPFGGVYSKALAPGFQRAAPEMRLDARNFSVSKQSTELTIRTKDGDLVTIKIKENERSRESLSIEARSDQESLAGGIHSEFEFKQKNSERSYSEFDAIFGNGEVSDVSYEFKSKSKEQTSFEGEVEVGGKSVSVDYGSKTVSTSRLSFEVEGSLDEGELEAIGELLDGVNALADEFFDGDVMVAFDQARKLGFDDTEIAGYSLNMMERETTVAMSRFEEAYGARPSFPLPIAQPIGEYLQGYEASVQQLNRYFESQVVDQVLKMIVERNREYDDKEEDGYYERFESFNERIEELLDERGD